MLDAVRGLQRAMNAREVQEAYISTISSAVAADGHGIYLLNPSNMRPVDVAANVPDTFLQQYEDDGRSDDPVLASAVATMQPIDSSRLPRGYCWHNSRALSILQQAGFYHSLEAPVMIDGQVVATLNMTRKQDQHPFSRQDLSVMQTLADQVGVALARTIRQEQISTKALLLADALDVNSQPIIITNMDGKLIFRNRMASKTVPGSRSSYVERVQPTLLNAIEELKTNNKRVVTALETANPKQNEIGQIPDAEATGDQLLIKAVRLRRTQDDIVVAFLSYKSDRSSGLPDSSLPLSRRERAITELVGKGLTTKQIAELSFVSENTVKQHLKRIFSKLGVNSRTELINIVWKSATPEYDELQ